MEWNNATALQMRNIHLYYGTVHALKGVDFEVSKGEIHALVGNHRAGKSSLVKIVSGVERKSEGDIFIHGHPVEYLTAGTAFKYGIGMIYQDPMVFGNLSTLESIYIGHLGRNWFGRQNWSRKERKAKEICAKYNLHIDFKPILSQNTLNEQNLVEFLNVLVQEPEIIILDELSNRFNPEEMEKLYPVMFNLRDEGKSVIYISHNMDEIMRIADRVTILNDGINMGTEDIEGLDKMRLIKMTYSFAVSRQELEEENLQLFYLKKYNEDILRNIPIGVIILNEKDEIYLTNNAALGILDVDAGDYTGKTLEYLLHGKDFDGKDDFIGSVTRREYYFFEKLEYGGNVILKVTVIPFRDEEKGFLGTIILMEDITQDLNVMDYLFRAEKISSIAELAAGVAHEINNPLGIVQTYLDLLKVAELPEDPAGKLSKIEREIMRIGGIVKNLLSFSKSTEMKFNEVSLISVIDEVIDLLGHRLKKKDIECKRIYTVSDPRVRGDENRLKQLFINLTTNSIEALHEGGEIEIEVSKDPSEDVYIIQFRDNGSGIPEEVIQEIFNPFFSTKEEMKNAGLGLSICQHVVELHQGMIGCDSDFGEGTCFRITLPAG